MDSQLTSRRGYLDPVRAHEVLLARSSQPAKLHPTHCNVRSAGASSVGLAAIQLAKSFGARHIYVTAGSQEKIDSCKSLGATEGINYKTTVWEDEVRRRAWCKLGSRRTSCRSRFVAPRPLTSSSSCLPWVAQEADSFARRRRHHGLSRGSLLCCEPQIFETGRSTGHARTDGRLASV